jgi:hypothetical protein
MRAAIAPLALAIGALASALPALAQTQRIENEIAVFAALDKVTARISRLEIGLGQTVKFGSLKVTPRVCYSRPPTEPPRTTAFVEVSETKLDGNEDQVFSGWMFAESPGLNAVEHPVFDVWLTECTKPMGGRRPPVAAGPVPGAPARGAIPAPGPVPEETRRRRPR